ncbi:DUF4395 domain-containing protein [Salinibacillus xinjiangensis]|uniref:DUF4395 family protein n=1 Tax=Salinibacillus xinjiangensis TaxID=1229268 RepID=A0A6G1X4R1_9BACI|nr:DUF4395 domain-containing protein [Salinibacillus xinjiangensis]MRG85818.1 DUF4395 family protein [Salinibacillus xinjiangensis]
MTIPKPLVQTNQSFIVISVILAFVIDPWILLIPFTVGVITLLTKKNPVILIAKRFLPRPPNEYMQEDQQLFNQWVATTMLGLSLICHYAGFQLLGVIFSVMVAVAALVALLGFCVGCFIRYRYIMWKHKRTQSIS